MVDASGEGRRPVHLRIIATCLTWAALGGAADVPPPHLEIDGGKIAFVVYEMGYALSDDPNQSAACSGGMTRGYDNVGHVFVDRKDLVRGPSETEEAYARRVFYPAMNDPKVANFCTNPELAKGVDDRFRTMIGSDVRSEGVDLDGRGVRAGSKPPSDTCGHDDFRGLDGQRGIDNQFLRVVGCTKPYRPLGQHRDFTADLLAGRWGILVELSGVDDLNNDSDVQVTFSATTDAIRLGPARDPLRYATYTADPDPRMRRTARGHIVNGVLTTEPVDVRFYASYESIRSERPLNRARVRMAITGEGALDGILAGYTPIEAMYDLQFGFRRGTDFSGKPIGLGRRNNVGVGSAITLGYTCEGAYQALLRNADGDRDPATGKCGSISTQYRLKAVPAFVVDAASATASRS